MKSSRACYRIRRGKTPSGWRNGCVPRSKPPATRSQSNRLPRQLALASQPRTMRVLISPLCWSRPIRRSIAPRRWVAIVSSFPHFHHSRLLLGKHLGKPPRRSSAAFCLDQETDPTSPRLRGPVEANRRGRGVIRQQRRDDRGGFGRRAARLAPRMRLKHNANYATLLRKFLSPLVHRERST